MPMMKKVGNTVPAVNTGCHEGNLMKREIKNRLIKYLNSFTKNVALRGVMKIKIVTLRGAMKIKYLCCLKFESGGRSF